MPAVKEAYQDSLPENQGGLVSRSDLTGQQIRQLNQYQSLLSWYGIPTERVGENFIGHCPFNNCPELYGDKEPKFSMNVQTAQFRCFRCDAKGNNYSFIRQIHSLYYSLTSEAAYAALCKLRGNAFDIEACKEMQLAYNRVTKEWMLPVWPANGAADGINNLYVWREAYDAETGQPRRQILSGPSFKHIPYGIHRIRGGTQRPIWVVEGQWDYLSLDTLFRTVGQSSNNDILAAPGAGTFPGTALSVFNGREVNLLFDNDKAGTDGMQNIIRAMNSKGVYPTKLRMIQWPEGLPPGFDVSDVVTKLTSKFFKRVKK